jgi:hypothetical protein
MEITLKPEVKVQSRYWCLAVVVLLFAVIPYIGPWWARMLGCLLPAALIGTYRVSTVNGDKFSSQLSFAFVPLKPQKCNLPGVIYIETKYNAIGPGIGTFLMFGPLQFIFGYVFDLLIPALGGAYEIWLITAKGREIAAWQGFNQQHFEANVELLAARTGAEVRGRSR